jgi:hypothetical protein
MTRDGHPSCPCSSCRGWGKADMPVISEFACRPGISALSPRTDAFRTVGSFDRRMVGPSRMGMDMMPMWWGHRRLGQSA